MCPSCSASIKVPQAPASNSIAGQTDRIIDASIAQSSDAYELQTPAQSTSEHTSPPIPALSSSPTSNTGYDLHASQTAATNLTDLITVTCHVCATRTSTHRRNLGKKLRCVECGTVVPIVEAAKSQAQAHQPQKIDEATVGEYGVTDSTQVPRPEEVTIPFHCRLCESLMRGSLAEVGTEMVCPDCGTKTVVPPPQKTHAKAVVGAASDAIQDEYGLHQPNAAATDQIPTICALCHSRLMARPEQIGHKIQCPDCGTETVVSPPTHTRTGAVIGAMAAGSNTADYGVHNEQNKANNTQPVADRLVFACPSCARKIAASSKLAGRDVACPDCGTVIHIPQPPPAGLAQAPAVQEETVVHIGVDCPRCGTRIHATDRQVGQKLPCPDCDTPITIPPPKANAPVSQVVRGSEEYAVSGPQEVVEKTPMVPGGLKKDPTDDPDFDFLHDVDDPELKWRLQNRSDELAFLGHPGASSRWFSFCLSGFGVFALLAASFVIFGLPAEWDPTALAWAASLLSLLIAGVACLAWAAMFSVNLLAIVEDTSAGNTIVRNWPQGDWLEQIGGCFYALNSWMVSFVPITILLQFCPPARPAAMYLYTAAFWGTFPLVLLSMLEVGSVFVPLSGNVLASLFRRPGAWAWFYFRSFGLVALALAMYIAFWRHICGPIALPLLVPMTASLAMIYARWLGILGQSVQEVIEEASDQDEEENIP